MMQLQQTFSQQTRRASVAAAAAATTTTRQPLVPRCCWSAQRQQQQQQQQHHHHYHQQQSLPCLHQQPPRRPRCAVAAAAAGAGADAGADAGTDAGTAASTTTSSAVITDADRAHIRRALELAKRALGQTAPNPAVGCVLVGPDGDVVGEGFHPRAGLPHAEVYALRAAGNRAAGATAYVTLEPCNHYGRTPPCSQALVDAGVARVVVGVGDPNPLVAAAGLATLRAAGIDVALVGGAEEDACREVNAEWLAQFSSK